MSALRDAFTDFREAEDRVSTDDPDSVEKLIKSARALLDLGAQLFGTSSRAFRELLKIAG